MKKFLSDLLSMAVQGYDGKVYKVIPADDGSECSVFVDLPADKQAGFDDVMKEAFKIESGFWKNERGMYDLKINDEFSFAKSIYDFYKKAPNKPQYLIEQSNVQTKKTDIILAAYKTHGGYDDYASLLERLKNANLNAGEIIVHPVCREAQSKVDYHLLYKEKNGPSWLITVDRVLNLSSLPEILTAPVDLWYAIDLDYFKQFDLKTLAGSIAQMSSEKRSEFFKVYFPVSVNELNKTTFTDNQNHLRDAIILSEKGKNVQPKAVICKRAIEHGIPFGDNTPEELQPYYNHIFETNFDWYINFNFDSQTMESRFIECYAKKFPISRDETDRSENTGERFGFNKEAAQQREVFIALHRHFLLIEENSKNADIAKFNESVIALSKSIPANLLIDYLTYQILWITTLARLNKPLVFEASLVELLLVAKQRLTVEDKKNIQIFMQRACDKLDANSLLRKELSKYMQEDSSVYIVPRQQQQPQQQQAQQQQAQQQDIPTWLICSGLLVLTAALIKHPKKTIAAGVMATAAWFGYKQYIEAPEQSNHVINNTLSNRNV